MFAVLCILLLAAGAALLLAALRGRENLSKAAQGLLGLGGLALCAAGAVLLALVLTGRLVLPLW